MELVDTHAHLEGFNEITGVVERAKAAGVIGIVAVSADLQTSERALSLQRENMDFVRALIGIHPQETGKDQTAALRFVENHLDECIGIGEVGLDYWTKIDQDVQRSVFTSLLKIAATRGLPISVHSRGSWDDCYQLLQECEVRSAVFHWYSGGSETLKRILDSGYLVSATPASEYSKAHRQAIKDVPLDSLMLETDCPVRYHGRESEPADVAKTLTYVSALKGISPEVVASETTENALRFFRFRG